MTDKLRVGFVGLGNMGSGMARRLLAAGHELTVYNRTEEKARTLAPLGARIASSPAGLGESDCLVVMLSDDLAVESVLDGGLPLREGATVLIMSTISVALSRRLAERFAAARVRYIASPVLGRPDAAAAGKLFILASGNMTPDAERLFAILGQRTYYLPGEAWQAHLAKLAVNFLLMSAIESMGEAFALTRKGGIDPQVFFEILSTSVFGCPVYVNYGGMIAGERYANPAGFRMPLAAKDMRLARDAAAALGAPMPALEVVRERLDEALERGHADLDLAALGKVAAELASL